MSFNFLATFALVYRGTEHCAEFCMSDPALAALQTLKREPRVWQSLSIDGALMCAGRRLGTPMMQATRTLLSA